MPIIGIGASAGGLEAIREMLSAAELPTGMAYVIVQHLDPNHESMLAELLNRQTNLDVQQVSGGEKVEADNVYIIPPGHGLELKNGVLTLTEFEQPRGLRRPIDDFFESLAYDWTVNAACVILSGTGADGAIGLRAVKECGGVCLAQEPVTARYDGMPLAAVGTGLVDYVKRPAEMIDTLSDFFSRRSNSVGDEEISRVVSDHIDDVCNSLSELIGHDFSDYKRSTLERRVERRMQVLGIDDPQAYLQRVRKDEDECDALFRDLLINVTRFFRDNEHFDQLMTDVIKPLVAESRSTGEIRVWVAGCSSGEEAYSIAMLLHEKMRETATRPLVQIFATDIDESMLAIAREGRYPSASLTDIPEELRDRYTIGHGVDFQISPIIRDMIRFSSHSLIKDPPFAKIDLLSCRNLLIYFGERLQKSVLPLMHYSIRPGGYLFLGPSETVGRYEDLFAPIDARSRIFKRRPGSIRHPIDLPMGNNRSRRQSSGSQPGYSGKKDWQEEEVTRRIADRYAPASVLIDADGNVLTSYGRLSRYLEFPTGEGRQVSVLNLARGDLRRVLPSLMRDASSKDRRVVANGIEIKSEFGTQKVDLIADPVMDGHVLLIFRDREPFKQEYDEDLLDLNQADDQVQVLEDELRSTRNRLRTTVEELETANEELKSSNEEMMSMNEELQSTNEELSTVNDELKSKVDELSVANSDLSNFFASTALPLV
ncbi:MAG: chemotaxis protein, partial [Ponticaulis sp.]|nr:chemotaxis protein [Ponticaulis sp.]